MVFVSIEIVVVYCQRKYSSVVQRRRHSFNFRFDDQYRKWWIASAGACVPRRRLRSFHH